jgi:ribosomal protein L32
MNAERAFLRMDDMAEQVENEDSDLCCTCGEMHKGHICWLSRMGLIMEVQHLSDCPTVSCSSCGAKANLPHNVCFPEGRI